MSLVITLVTALALLLYAQHIDAQRRELRAAKREADLRRRLDAVELALPGIEAQYGSHSHSARYLRAAKYLTSLKLRHHNPRPAGRTATGGAR